MGRAGAGSWLARVAAPLAFLVPATLGVVPFAAALEEEDHGRHDHGRDDVRRDNDDEAADDDARQHQERASTTACRPATPSSRSPTHGTTVEALLELNPGIDPVALNIGQRIRVG